jgi:hypothetical protein
MTATPYFIYRSFVAQLPRSRLAPRRLTLRTRSTPGRIRHNRTRLALSLNRGR